MRPQMHSDASHSNEPKARSTAGGHYFLGNNPRDNQPIFLNGATHSLCQILKFVASSAAEAELGSLFLNAKKGKEMITTLTEMGHPQPPVPIHVDNSTTVGIANKTIKQQRSRAMEMRYFWVQDQVKNKHFIITWYPGSENLGDYHTKHHLASHHTKVRPYYPQQNDSPRYSVRTLPPRVMRGCVKDSLRAHQTRGSLPRVTRRSKHRPDTQEADVAHLTLPTSSHQAMR